jgi:predicted DNA-binding transcriptional regulator AlpA
MQPLLTQRQCAEALALSERTLERFRVSGVGPKFVRMGKSIRYRLSDVDAWIASRVVGSTAEDINVRCNARNVERTSGPRDGGRSFASRSVATPYHNRETSRALQEAKHEQYRAEVAAHEARTTRSKMNRKCG